MHVLFWGGRGEGGHFIVEKEWSAFWDFQDINFSFYEVIWMNWCDYKLKELIFSAQIMITEVVYILLLQRVSVFFFSQFIVYLSLNAQLLLVYSYPIHTSKPNERSCRILQTQQEPNGKNFYSFEGIHYNWGGKILPKITTFRWVLACAFEQTLHRRVFLGVIFK